MAVGGCTSRGAVRCFARRSPTSLWGCSAKARAAETAPWTKLGSGSSIMVEPLTSLPGARCGFLWAIQFPFLALLILFTWFRVIFAVFLINFRAISCINCAGAWCVWVEWQQSTSSGNMATSSFSSNTPGYLLVYHDHPCVLYLNTCSAFFNFRPFIYFGNSVFDFYVTRNLKIFQTFRYWWGK